MWLNATFRSVRITEDSMIDFNNLPSTVNGVKRPEQRCKHEIHESMKGKPLEKWHIRIFGYEPDDEETGKGPWAGDLIMSIFDQNGKSWDVLAVGVDGKLHLFKKVGYVNGVKVIDIEGIKLDSQGRIVVES
jgi:hypothetical protein